MKTKEALLTCKLDFDDRDILCPIRNYDIAYAEWCKDNNEPPGYDTFEKFKTSLSRQILDKERHPRQLPNAISKFRCLCMNSFISWCEINKGNPSEDNWDIFFDTILDVVDGICQGINMLKRNEATDVYLLVTAGKGLKEEIHINHFLDIGFMEV